MRIKKPCPYFGYVIGGEYPFGMCESDGSAGECRPFTENCKLYNAMVEVQTAIYRNTE